MLVLSDSPALPQCAFQTYGWVVLMQLSFTIEYPLLHDQVCEKGSFVASCFMISSFAHVTNNLRWLERYLNSPSTSRFWYLSLANLVSYFLVREHEEEKEEGYAVVGGLVKEMSWCIAYLAYDIPWNKHNRDREDEPIIESMIVHSSDLISVSLSQRYCHLV